MCVCMSPKPQPPCLTASCSGRHVEFMSSPFCPQCIVGNARCPYCHSCPLTSVMSWRYGPPPFLHIKSRHAHCICPNKWDVTEKDCFMIGWSVFNEMMQRLQAWWETVWVWRNEWFSHIPSFGIISQTSESRTHGAVQQKENKEKRTQDVKAHTFAVLLKCVVLVDRSSSPLYNTLTAKDPTTEMDYVTFSLTAELKSGF